MNENVFIYVGAFWGICSAILIFSAYFGIAQPVGSIVPQITFGDLVQAGVGMLVVTAVYKLEKEQKRIRK